MSSSSAKSAFDFLRLAGELAEIVAASGVNFLESVAAGADFFLARIVQPQFPPNRRALIQVAIAIPALVV
jgi:hypothetical protein